MVGITGSNALGRIVASHRFVSDARNIVAMQQCAFCLTNETGTEFTHIANRAPGASSKLSHFLTGKTGDKLSTVLELWDAADTAFHSTTVHPSGLGPDGNACPPPPVTIARSFHDLARRALFLAAGLAFPEETAENASMIEFARTNFSH
jgi:hypothetical protein